MAISIPALVLALLIALGIGVAAGRASCAVRIRDGDAQARRLRQDLEQARVDAAAAVARNERLAEENDALIERAGADAEILRAMAPLHRQLEAMGRSVQGLHETQAAQGARIREQLANAQRIQERMREETGALRAALSSTSARGYWGEAELARIVEAAGMLAHVDFETQKATSSLSARGDSSRPDMVIRLPGEAFLALDAKAPLTALLEASALPDTCAAERAELLKRHAAALRRHVQALAKRDYPAKFAGSPPYTVMFLPAESVLSTALEADPTLLEDALALGIVPATPSSLLAVLKSASAMWTTAKATEESERIVELGQEMTARLAVMARHLDSVGKSLKASVAAYNRTVGSLEKRVLTTVRQFESLADQAPPVEQIDADAAQVRDLVSLRPEELIS